MAARLFLWPPRSLDFEPEDSYFQSELHPSCLLHLVPHTCDSRGCGFQSRLQQCARDTHAHPTSNTNKHPRLPSFGCSPSSPAVFHHSSQSKKDLDNLRIDRQAPATSIEFQVLALQVSSNSLQRILECSQISRQVMTSILQEPKLFWILFLQLEQNRQ